MIGHLVDFLYVGYFLTCSLLGLELATLLASIYIAADKYSLDDLKALVVHDLAEDWCMPTLTEEEILKVSERIYCNARSLDEGWRELFIELASKRFRSPTFARSARDYLFFNAALAEDLLEAQRRAMFLS